MSTNEVIGNVPEVLHLRSPEVIEENPWHTPGTGDGQMAGAFTGAWSDWSEEWQLVTRKEMKRLKLNFEDEGGFFMSFEDFLRFFTTLTICQNRTYRVHTSTYEVAHMVTYMNAREVLGRAHLAAGRYVVIPTTFSPNIETDFLIRFQTLSSTATFTPLTKDLPPISRLKPFPIGVLRLEIVNCVNLVRQKIWGPGADPYCIIHVFDASSRPTSTQRTGVQRSTLNPTFRASFMWAIRHPRECIVRVEVWNRYGVGDRFLGCVVFKVEDYMGGDRKGRTWEVDLGVKGREGREGELVGGSVRLRVRYEDSLDRL
ncbi:C2 domain-containing protein [Chytridium lagenaria]|nr:C2 domain-containing protein [Chytridium lagenaria]